MILLISGCGSAGPPAPPPLSRVSVEFLLQGLRGGTAALAVAPVSAAPTVTADPVECTLFDYPGTKLPAADGWVRAVTPGNYPLVVDAASRAPADPYHLAFQGLLTSPDHCRSFTSGGAAVELRRYPAPPLGTAAALVSVQSAAIRRQGLQQRILLVASGKLLLRLSGPLVMPGDPVADQLAALAKEILDAADGVRLPTVTPTAAPPGTSTAAPPGTSTAAPAATADPTADPTANPTAEPGGPGGPAPGTGPPIADEVLAQLLTRYFDPLNNPLVTDPVPARVLLTQTRGGAGTPLAEAAAEPAECRVFLDYRSVDEIPGVGFAALRDTTVGQRTSLEVHSDSPQRLLAAEFGFSPEAVAACGAFTVARVPAGTGQEMPLQASVLAAGHAAGPEEDPQPPAPAAPATLGDAWLTLLMDTGVGFVAEQRVLSGNLSATVTLFSLTRPEQAELETLRSTARTVLAHLMAELSMR